MSMTSTMSLRVRISSSRNCSESLSNFSGENLLRSAFVLRLSFARASSSAWFWTRTYAFSDFSKGFTGCMFAKPRRWLPPCIGCCPRLP